MHGQKKHQIVHKNGCLFVVLCVTIFLCT